MLLFSSVFCFCWIFDTNCHWIVNIYSHVWLEGCIQHAFECDRTTSSRQIPQYLNIERTKVAGFLRRHVQHMLNSNQEPTHLPKIHPKLQISHPHRSTSSRPCNCKCKHATPHQREPHRIAWFMEEVRVREVVIHLAPCTSHLAAGGRREKRINSSVLLKGEKSKEGVCLHDVFGMLF